MENNKLQVYRTERKYMISLAKAAELKNEFDLLLTPDAYSAKSPSGAYMVRSLYFDSINNDDFFEKDAGVFDRKKIRLRVYSPEDEKAKLELKAKKGDSQHKESLVVTKAEAKLLQEGDYTFLLDRGDDLSLRLYSVMTLGVYRPVALVEYERRAYVYDEFNTRITFDSAIKASETDMDVFKNTPFYNYLLDNEVVLEVKYNGELFSPISGILKKHNIFNVSYSKYGSGRWVMV